MTAHITPEDQKILEDLPTQDILALAESCIAIRGAQIAAGSPITPEERDILDRYLPSQP